MPALYGILALNIRQFLQVGAFYLLFYSIAMFGIWYAGDIQLDTPVEIMQFMVLFMVVAQIALIGGFINQLRGKLRNRNDELKRTSAELAEAAEKIRELATRDALTGAFNRRHLIDVLSQETNRRNRSAGPYSLCLMDLDFFKKVNDIYGHTAGDAVLKAIAQATEQDLRTIDCFGRYGGEEFLVILPQTPLDGACIKAERIRQAIADLDFSDISKALAVTVSIGVAENMPDEGFAETINRADVALYRAKERGRNQVESSQDELVES